jgi:hypothetical protein
MKKLISFAFLVCSVAAYGQVSDVSSGSVQLTSTCSNANSTCDSAGVTNFVPNSPFNVQGPQTLEMNTQGYGLVQITISGTYSGATENFEFSDDGGTTWYSQTCARSDTNLQEASETIANNAFRAIECGVGAATKFRVRQSALTSGTPIIKATMTSGLLEPAPTMQLSSAGTLGTNPCLNPHSPLKSATVSMSGTTLAQFVAAAAGQIIYPCFFFFANGSSSATVAIKAGSGSNCGTGTLTVLDAFTLPQSTASPIYINGPIAVLPANDAICYILTGTTPTGSMLMTYVQQ